MNELERLQQRIDMRNAELARQESDLAAVAVSIEDGPLHYAELDLIWPERDFTPLGREPERELIAPRGQWRMEVDGFVQPVTEPVTVQFGDTRSQPYEGKAFITMVDIRAIHGGYVSVLKSTGPLEYHREADHG